MAITSVTAPAAQPERGRLVKVLRRTGLFDGLAESELVCVAGLVRRRRYARGMVVFLEGEPVEAVYFLEAGSVKAFTTGADGTEHIISVLGPGDFFPHVGFLDGGPAPGTTQALEDAVLWTLERREFYRLLTENPTLAARMVAVLGERIRRLQLQLQSLTTPAVAARVAGALVRLARQHGAPDPERPGSAIWLTVPLSHRDLAGLAGTTRESVTRTLSEFRRAGLVAVKRGRLVLLDPSRLEGIR